MTASALKSAYEASLDCVHCGLCLPACPTYSVTSSEVDSPRGRIYVMRALAEGRIEPTDPLVLPPLERCLDCRACESACPSGVRYGTILEEVRTGLNDAGNRGARRRLLRLLLDRFVSSKGGHRFAIGALAFAQATGLARAARLLPLPKSLKQSLSLVPKLPGAREREPIEPGIYEPFGPKRAEIGLFTGCMMETVFGRVNRALLHVLRRNGCRVHIPAAQGCCGALHLHAGLRDAARPLVDRNIAAFPNDLDAIILDSAGCGSAMKEYAHWHDAAATFSAKVRDMSEFLVSLGIVRPTQPIVRRIAYDDACHLCHGQRIRTQPRELLAAIDGLELAPLQKPEDCCGSGGIYNILQPELADPILEQKVEDVLQSGADTVVTGNPGCMLQISLGLRRRGSPVDVQHTAEILAAAYGAPGPQ